MAVTSKKTKSKVGTLLLCVPILCLASCSETNASLDDYISELEFHENFTICNLNDVHLSAISNLDRDFEFVKNSVYSISEINPDISEPDLIVLNGDAFMGANKKVVDKFFDFMDSFGIPWCYDYGNHDYQGTYSHGYIDSVLKTKENCLYKSPDDDVYGNSNYVINLVENGSTKWQIYVFDSNQYYKTSYDVIHDDQIEWYEKEIQYANGISSVEEVSTTEMIPSLTFFHIPFEEFQYAWDDVGNAKYGGNDEVGYWYMYDAGVSDGYRDNDLFEVMQQYESTVGIVCGHDHTNNSDFYFNGGGREGYTDWTIRLIYAEKCTYNIYHDEDITGAAFFTLSSEDNTFTCTRTRVDYDGNVSEITDEMFAKGDVSWKG
ncbi:MAG: hypothetical protein LUD22_01665 [Coprobacillus sp.]|nr:hypothetical protein [Coprobacillus sp.]